MNPSQSGYCSRTLPSEGYLGINEQADLPSIASVSRPSRLLASAWPCINTRSQAPRLGAIGAGNACEWRLPKNAWTFADGRWVASVFSFQ